MISKEALKETRSFNGRASWKSLLLLSLCLRYLLGPIIATIRNDSHQNASTIIPSILATIDKMYMSRDSEAILIL